MSEAAKSAQSAPAQRPQRRSLTGRVTSTRMKDTITVLVQRTFKHPKYGKIVRRSKAYHAHDPAEQAHLGDLVEIAATRPISKLKRWRLVRIVEAAPERGAEVSTIDAPAGGDTPSEGAPTEGASAQGAAAAQPAASQPSGGDS
jgi:small subunit ribosomal protein S17